ncbi:MAG: TraB/GumN family protein [Nitrospirota bacterium]|jgi:uncharacterized protein YbaP (TraB family)
MSLYALLTTEKKLRMMWKIEKDKKTSYLVGAAHFFPYSFKKFLSPYINNANTVLLEGPLDENNMDKVVEQGAKGNNNSSLDGLLDDNTITEINKLEYIIQSPSYYGTFMMTYGGQSRNDLLYNQIKDKRSWMAFFNIWFYYRARNGWKYTMDMDALNIAKEKGKEVHFLEKIEEQIKALNGIPVERIVNFLKRVNKWDMYGKRYVKYYLKGDLKGLLSGVNDFPTYCESIIDKRDPILYERMKPFLEKGNALAVVGITHIQGIKKMLVNDGYDVKM